MGNRAVYVSADTNCKNANEKIGIYVHWYGGEKYINKFLEEAKKAGVRNWAFDSSYFWARLCQIVTNFLTSEGEPTLSVGIDIVSHLDCNNWDNGVYYINDDFTVEKQTNGEELEINYEKFISELDDNQKIAVKTIAEMSTDDNMLKEEIDKLAKKEVLNEHVLLVYAKELRKEQDHV